MPNNPTTLLGQWLEEAIALKVNEPTAMLVASASKSGMPSIRTVLLKEVLNGELVFYSNYESRKGIQLAENPQVACTFMWHELERQIHIEGNVRKLSPEESDAYFAIRPYKSRVGARISPQSRAIPNREYIIALFAAESLKFIGREIPRPDYWGGYAVDPIRIEFWQGRDSRLHDRFVYTKDTSGAWTLERIAP